MHTLRSQLETLLNDDRLNMACEEEVFESVMLWLQRNQVTSKYEFLKSAQAKYASVHPVNASPTGRGQTSSIAPGATLRREATSNRCLSTQEFPPLPAPKNVTWKNSSLSRKNHLSAEERTVKIVAPVRVNGKPRGELVVVDLDEMRWALRSCRLGNMHSDYVHEQVLNFCIHVVGRDHEMIG